MLFYWIHGYTNTPLERENIYEDIRKTFDVNLLNSISNIINSTLLFIGEELKSLNLYRKFVLYVV